MKNRLEKVKLNYIDLGLNLSYSYMLPLFNVDFYDRGIRVVKILGACSGMECFIKEDGTICLIPDSCDYETFKSIVGLEKGYLVDDMIKRYDLIAFNKVFYRFAPIYSQADSLFIAISIYLSRNTDYFLNTVKWVREIVEKNCYSKPMICRDRFNSYQFREFLSNINDIRKAVAQGDPYVSANNLMRVKGFGVKSAMAYLLHACGLTRCAPIDRHYIGFLERIGFKGSIPAKNKCIENKLLCFSCKYSYNCLYWLVQKSLGELSGLIQSIIYVYNRVSKLNQRSSVIEYALLSRLHRDLLIKGVEKLIEALREDLG